MALVLVVDDERGIREVLRAALAADGHDVLTASGATAALEHLRERPVDLLITDLAMPGIDGVELLRRAREIRPDVPAIVITAYGSKETAIEAMRHGAVNYLEKPFDVEELRLHAARALGERRLSHENRRLRARLGVAERLIGSSPAIRELRELVARIAPSDSTVLITGESGTGKEVVARALHAASPRAAEPFVGINCGAIPPELLESELFGHEKGAFTGAERARRGLLEAAAGGTLFLDEIGDMPVAMQVKLLRVLQERTIRRVGGTEEIPVAARIVAATHQDLEALVREGRFREDLYYRVHVIRIHVPPLRERKEDIPEFVRCFVQRISERSGRPIDAIDPAFLDRLTGYDWPGNVRELENVVERAVTLARGRRLTPDLLPPEIGGRPLASPPGALPERFDLEAHLEQERRRYMEAALEACGGVQTRAAERLGMSFRSFRYFAKKYALGGRDSAARTARTPEPVGEGR
ncbi:MAG: sigma-54-dependent Fis family transcriptional regulator [Acidobacteria bacterium]|nr:MAG: sigma-54-dependent Fis family transcriptional regulator [Acidobacteriota bacterium]